jgi:hypothetical protein
MTSVAMGHAGAGDLAEEMRRFWRSLRPIQGRAGLPAWLRPRQRDVVNGREPVRLRLVAVACEIQVLVSFIEQELPAGCREPEAREIRMGCRHYRSVAEKLISDSAITSEHSLLELCADIDVAYTELVNVRRLRDRVTGCAHARLRAGVNQDARA